MQELSIIGFGELGQQFYSFLNKKDLFFNVFDDEFYSEDIYLKVNLFNEYLVSKSDNFYVALGYKHLKIKDKILNNLENQNKITPLFIHKSCFINKNANIQEATFIYPMCNIDKNVFIDKGTLINNSVTVSHDTKIGRCCYISPGVIISGQVEIGDYTFIGSGSIISNGV